MKKTFTLLWVIVLFTNSLVSQEKTAISNDTLLKYITDLRKEINGLKSNKSAPTSTITEEKKVNWYEKIQVRGYVQVRYNRLFETNPDLKSDQGDKSIGNLGGFFIRRNRLILSGQVNDHVYFYIQPDFASSASTNALHFAQIRDAYFDVSIDKKREFRFRIGQSKVPYGFENMQSSQNRKELCFDQF